MNLRKARILDVGCGTGYLLHLLKNVGMTDLMGVDQSCVAAEIGINRYKIDIEVESIFNFKNRNFDCILLCHVLEHIVDISNFIIIVDRLLAKNGIIYIEVPDALQFGNFIDPQHSGSSIYEPDVFTHFTPEHINYFTPNSLRNLMFRFGFEEIFCESDPLGVVISAWKPRRPVLDSEGEACLLNYISGSSSLLNTARARIKLLAEKNIAILVWGVGLHTQRLLAVGDFSSIRIIAFIDSDPNYNGKQLFGIDIISVDKISSIPGEPPILISSLKSQLSILKTIDRFKIPNKIIKLYPN